MFNLCREKKVKVATDTILIRIQADWFGTSKLVVKFVPDGKGVQVTQVEVVPIKDI